jgi:hypothetical protein
MDEIMKSLKRVALSIIALAAVLPSADRADAQSLQQQLVGTWTLVSNVVIRPGGVRIDQFGPSPRGVLLLSADGHFATLNARSDLPKLASGSRSKMTADEAQAIALGTLAYYGVNSVSDADKVITVRIEGSTFANQIGSVQKRVITSLTSDEMRFTNPAATSGGQIELVWKRMK